LVVDDIIVGKRAIGPEPDGTYPDPPADAVECTLDEYKAAQLNDHRTPGWVKPTRIGRPHTHEEVHAQIQARGERMERLLGDARSALQTINQRLNALQADINLLKARITALERQ
jgi:hypothetical protein